MKQLFLLLAIFLTCFLQAKAPKQLVVPSIGTGLFSEFKSVIGALDLYETKKSSKHPYAGIKVDFKKNGLYYTRTKGNNFWNYYFEPINIKEKKTRKKFHISGVKLGDISHQTGFSKPIEYSRNLVQKYIRVKPYIINEVNAFYNAYLQGSYVIGVHYRGTDKSTEAPRVSYESVFLKIVETVNRAPHDNWRLFVATDEVAFLQFLQQKFPNKVCALKAKRSADQTPVHINRKYDKFLLGKEAVMDCLLLSKSDVLLRTASNLSWCSLLFNPQLPSVSLSQPIDGCR